MDLYSVTLGLAMAATSLALGLTLTIWLLPVRDGASHRRKAVARRTASAASVTALGLLIISAAFHFRTGHARDSGAALDPSAFLAMHPALVVTAALAAMPLAALRIARAKDGANMVDTGDKVV